MLRKFKNWFENNPPEELAFTEETVTIGAADYLLRRMTNDDIDAALAIERAVYNDTPWDRVAFLSELRKRQHSLYLVLALPQSGLVVGFVGCWFSKNEAHITNLAVAPGYQRRGIGRALMQWMLAKALDYGSAQLTLEVRVDNRAAQALYHQLGFVDGAIKKGYYVAHHDDAMDMSRNLNQ